MLMVSLCRWWHCAAKQALIDIGLEACCGSRLHLSMVKTLSIFRPDPAAVCSTFLYASIAAARSPETAHASAFNMPLLLWSVMPCKYQVQMGNVC